MERPDPEGAAGKVVVRMSATTVQPADLWIRSGGAAQVLPGLPQPFVLGWDVMGTVAEDGGGFRRGQRVAGLYPWMDLADSRGTYAEAVLVDSDWLAAVPDEVDDATAATLPLNALAARRALDLLTLPAGAGVLVSGASGAVGGWRSPPWPPAVTRSTSATWG